MGGAAPLACRPRLGCRPGTDSDTDPRPVGCGAFPERASPATGRAVARFLAERARLPEAAHRAAEVSVAEAVRRRRR